MEILLPRRTGPRPRTTPSNPHTQLDQQPDDPALIAELARRAFALPDVDEQPSAISVPGARALWLRSGVPAGPPQAFLIGREFAHLHPDPDSSLHLCLPPTWVDHVLERGWGELHPVARMGLIPATAAMVYAPRDTNELDVVTSILHASYHFAREAAGDGRSTSM
jgi:hypothetical protein